MSHNHSHGPGEPSHSHGPAPPAKAQLPMPAPPPDPAGQALLDQDFQPVDVATSADGHSALCGPHQLEKCSECNVDYVNLNRLSRILAQNPNLRCFPPPNAVTNNLSAAITSTKEEGNRLFKMKQYAQAINRYNTAAAICVQRPPWESHQSMRDELSAILSNRSAAYFECHDYVSALADAESVIQLKRPWSKGHFRKASALVGLHRLDEAENAMALGLAFDPQNPELSLYVKEIRATKLREKLDKIQNDSGAQAAETAAAA